MRKILCFFLFLLLSGPVLAQENLLRGVVVNAETGDTLRRYILQYKRFGITEIPDSSGRFSIVKLAEYLTVYSTGFQELRFLVGANTPDILRITLRPEEKDALDSLTMAEIRRINQQEMQEKRRNGLEYFKFDPLRNLVAFNAYDGFRGRVGGQTTALLSKRWFFKGYAAHGWKSQESYYDAEVACSLTPKEHLLGDFPRRSLSLSSGYDVGSPSYRFSESGNDNVFTSLRWAKSERLVFSRRQRLAFHYDAEGGMRYSAALKMEKNTACHDLDFPALKTTEMRAGIGYLLENEDERLLDLSVGHCLGLNGFLGGEHGYNVTEVSASGLFGLDRLGSLSLRLKGGVQWNRVPLMLLLMPAANPSYFLQEEAFGLLNDMEFINDRYASAMAEWNLKGLFLHKVSLLKSLGCQEALGFRCLWGSLSDRNRPQEMPDGCYLMDSNRPYCEFVAGIKNIARCFQIQYVRRLNYNELEGAAKNGVRFMFVWNF